MRQFAVAAKVAGSKSPWETEVVAFEFFLETCRYLSTYQFLSKPSRTRSVSSCRRRHCLCRQFQRSITIAALALSDQMQCNAILCNRTQPNPMQCNAIIPTQRDATQGIAKQSNATMQASMVKLHNLVCLPQRKARTHALPSIFSGPRWVNRCLAKGGRTRSLETQTAALSGKLLSWRATTAAVHKDTCSCHPFDGKRSEARRQSLVFSAHVCDEDLHHT